eukprot:1161781-Pelagomonas_calceolata.AAC.9
MSRLFSAAGLLMRPNSLAGMDGWIRSSPRRCHGTYYNLVPSTDPPDGNRPALGIVPVASSGRGPSSAKKELEVLERFEHGSALALTVTREGFDPLSQQVRRYGCVRMKEYTLCE